MNKEQEKRYKKIFSDELYLIKYDIKETDNKILEFHIAGSTKNIYKCKFTNISTDCDCPDNRSWAKKYHVVCKHVCFVIFKVLKIYKDIHGTIALSIENTNQSNGVNNLDPTNFFSDLHFSNSEFILAENILLKKLVSSDVINIDLATKYENLLLTNTQSEKNKSQEKNKFQISYKDLDPKDDCPICYDELGIDNLLSCPDCKNFVHNRCVEKWLQYNKSCVYCRSEIWIQLENLNKPKKNSKYINIS